MAREYLTISDLNDFSLDTYFLSGFNVGDSSLVAIVVISRWKMPKQITESFNSQFLKSGNVPWSDMMKTFDRRSKV